jgi:molybdate transport repressor ModE-like protein
LVHRPQFGTRPPGRREERDPLREVQMENIHPLRLRLLLEIERTRSISAAAQACGIGQPSASMHVRNLEATLGQRLVTRNGRGSSLTPAGKVVASHAARMLATLDSMRRAVDAIGARGGGELAIAASHMPSVAVIPGVLRQLSDRYPGLTVKVHTWPSEAVVHAVARGEADIGIAGEVPTAEPVTRRHVATDELIGIASPRLLDGGDGWISLEQLALHRLLVGPEGSSTRIVSERCLAGAGYRAASVWQLDSYEAVISAARHGLGVSFASPALVADPIARSDLVAFRISGVDPMVRPIQSLQNVANPLSPQASTFMALLAEMWRSDEPSPESMADIA